MIQTKGLVTGYHQMSLKASKIAFPGYKSQKSTNRIIEHYVGEL
jgi:hypothetical protein